MPIFEYQAINNSGKELKGKIDASNEKTALSQLQSQGLFPIAIKAVKTTESFFKQKSKKKNTPIVPAKLITAFIRQFSVLIRTGISYDKGLEIIIQECEHAALQTVISDIRSHVIEGSSLAQSLEGYPKLFPKMLVAMVKAGEAGGLLDDVLMRLVAYRETQEKLRSRIQTALIYPSVMSCLGVAIVVFMVTFILPKIIPIFTDFGVALPLPTRIVIALSDYIKNYGWYTLFAIIASIYGIKRIIHSEKYSIYYDRVLLKLPLLKKVLVKIITFRFTQALGTLLESGVDIQKALEIILYITGNKVFENSIKDLTLDITKKGLTLSQALRKTALFPGTVIQMIRVGEEGSDLEKILVKISEELEVEVNDTLEKAVTLLEPIIILLMALGVGFIIVAIMLPMFALNELI